MILTGQKKRILKDIIRYYVKVTDYEYDDFIMNIQKTRGKAQDRQLYPEWLAAKCFEILDKHGITLADCIENKDTIHSAINEDKSRMEGEFYTPEVWASEGREYLKKTLGDLWGEAYIWDASCGTGNLLRTANYPTDKMFMSTLLEEDINIIKGMPEFQGVTAFPCDFVNGIDYDENNKGFSNKLPRELVEVLEQNKPLVFLMNPPYKVMEAKSSDIGVYMASQGMTKCALDIFHQFIYRIIMLKRFYNLTNVYLGIFGPVTMFHSPMLEPLYEELKREFRFEDGMCFGAGDFANTSESVGWIVGYTVWKTKKEGEEDKSIVLDAKTADADSNISVIGKKLITGVSENLHNWVEAKDILRYDLRPEVTSMKYFTNKLSKHPSNALGAMLSSNFVLRATRRAALTSLPNPDNVAVTAENFWRCVASFGARRSYASKQNPYNNCQYYSKPDTTIHGYNEWLIDAVALFLFDYTAYWASYRGVEIDGTVWDVPNKMFPIDIEIAKSVITDPVIITDMEKYGANNQGIVNMLKEIVPKFSKEAKDLYDFCIQIIVESLNGDKRKEDGYSNWTMAWDAGLSQIRLCKTIWTSELEEKYAYLLAKLKDKLYEGVYKYGFMVDTMFTNDEDEVEDELE